MTTEHLVYLSIIGLGVITSVALQVRLYRSVKQLPGGWKDSPFQKKFRLGIWFLIFFLFVQLTCEFIALYLATHMTYNSFVFSINETLSIPCLLGFFYLHTYHPGKRFIYLFLYAVLLVYLVHGNYYDPDCILPGTSALLFNAIYFLGALIHLTDLLVNPKSDHFRFQLKIDLSVLIFSLLAIILTSSTWYADDWGIGISDLIFDMHFYNVMLFYFMLALIFFIEILKLRRK